MNRRKAVTLELNTESYQKLYLAIRLNNAPAGRPLVMDEDRVITEIVEVRRLGCSDLP